MFMHYLIKSAFQYHHTTIIRQLGMAVLLCYKTVNPRALKRYWISPQPFFNTILGDIENYFGYIPYRFSTCGLTIT